MLISKSALKRFWNQPRRRTRKYKRMKPRAIRQLLEGLEPPPRFVTEPRHHQRVSFLLGAKFKRYFFQLDPGLGKTKLVLDLIRWRKRRGEVHRALVLVPGIANVQGWLDEAAIHAPKLRVVGIDQKTREKREAALHADCHVVVMTYMAYLSFVCEGKVDEETGEPVKGWKWNKGKVTKFAKDFDALVVDEPILLGNSESLMHRAVWQFAKRCTVRYGLNGTIFGSDPNSIWGQFRVIDGGETLGEGVGLYRAWFFKPVKHYFSKWPTYKFDNTKTKELHRVLQHRSIRYQDKECLDLPPRVEIPLRITFSSEIWRYYEQLTTELSEARGNFKLLDSVFHRLRGTVAGYLSVKDPEGERLEVVFKKNPKLDALVDLIRSIPEDRQILIFCEYKVTGKIICERLAKEKIKHRRLYSKTKNKGEVVRDFQTKRDIRAFVLSSAGARGLNLQMANYVIFYEAPLTQDTYVQEIKRAERTGQTRKVFVYRMVVKGSVDEKIYKAIDAGYNLFEAIANGKESL